jgi:hypothetical protein
VEGVDGREEGRTAASVDVTASILKLEMAGSLGKGAHPTEGIKAQQRRAEREMGPVGAMETGV